MKLNIGENIRRLRRAADMTQEQLADKLGVAYQSVSRWENGTTYPDSEFLPALSGIFGVTVDELIGCEEIRRNAIISEKIREYNALCGSEETTAEALLPVLRELRKDCLSMARVSEEVWWLFRRILNGYPEIKKNPAIIKELRDIAEELLSRPLPNTRVFCVPFVDLDGVLDGDQGKNRIPHDHNRDYTEEPIYPEVAAIKRYAEDHGCHFAFDFHSPWHRGGENDQIFIVQNSVDRTSEYDRFGALLEKECNESSMTYRRENDHPPCTGWNQPSSNLSYVMQCRHECRLAFSLESAYFGCEENKVSASRLMELGKAFGRAFRQYIEEGS